MDHADRIVRARAALDALESLLGTHTGREADPAIRAELRRHLGELRHLLAALEEGDEPAVRGESADDARDASAD